MIAYPKIALFINGEPRTRDGVPVINPSDGTQIGIVPHATRTDLDDALVAAERGFRTWKATAPAVRSAILRRAAVLLRERISSIAPVISLEQGKPIAQSETEIQRTCEILDWDAEEGRRAYGRIIFSGNGIQNKVIREPIGVVAAFSPWNAPLLSPARKTAGALAAGCSIILKASEETPAGAMILVQALAEAGVPPGVVNLVFGIPVEISSYLIPNPIIRLVTFTGSVSVGKQLSAMAGQYMKPVIMELGGHSPVFVCKDADIQESVAAIITAKSRNAGQVCVSPTRILVEKPIYHQFEEAFVKQAKYIRPGHAMHPDTKMGPLANVRRLEAMDRLVKNAVKHGASILSGGERMTGKGFYFPLTTLADVSDDAQLMHEEPFGPIAILRMTDDLSDAISQANRLPFGLSAYAFTDSASAIDRIETEVQAGTVSINHMAASFAETPFGGVKDSGYGREGGTEGLYCYTVAKNVSIRNKYVR